jgi:hypothetical protein
LLMFVAWSRSRKAISPVPPAMSSIFQPGELPVEEEPGLRLRTKWSLEVIRIGFLRRCQVQQVRTSIIGEYQET